MDILGQLLTGGRLQATYGPDHDFWYTPHPGIYASAGVRIDEEGAKKVSAWYRGRFILASAVAILPLKIYRRLANGSREEAHTHPLYDTLHRKPNAWQDAFQQRLEAMFWLIDYGYAYYAYTDGPRGFADQLVPIAPSRVTPERMKSGALRGQEVYHVRDEATGRTTTQTLNELFVLRGPDGKGILEHARDSLGLGVALESYAARLFRQGGLHGHIIKVPGPMNKEQSDALSSQWSTGLTHAHSVKVLAHGAELQQTTMDPEKLQMILSRKFSINDIARWLGLPPHMLGDLDRATFSNIEHQAQEFVDYSLGPWLTLFEAAINDQMMLRPETYYAEFTRDALVRGDIETRWRKHVESVNAGIVTVDEVRVTENLPKRGGAADELRQPQNITGKPSGFSKKKNAPEPAPAEDEASDEQARAIARASAARLLRKEIAAVQKLAVKYAADSEGFAAGVTDFYASHAALVADTLCVSQVAAQDYCSQQAAQLLTGVWMDALDLWSRAHYAAGVAALALEEAPAA